MVDRRDRLGRATIAVMPRQSRFRITSVFVLSIAMLAATQVILGQSPCGDHG